MKATRDESMESSLEFQGRVPLSYSLGFDPGPAYGRIMYGLRERILLRGHIAKLRRWAKEIFPEEVG